MMFDQVELMQKRIEDLEHSLRCIQQWCRAYPVPMFKELTNEQIELAGEVLKFHSIDIGALHASWARHLLKGIGEIADTALQ